MDGWINGWLNGWVDGWICQYIGGWVGYNTVQTTTQDISVSYAHQNLTFHIISILL